MAESAEGASWWGGWLQSAKDKSATAIEFLKKDLTEFSTTVSNDGAKAASAVKSKLNQENATAATQKMKAGVSTLLDGISKALVIEPGEEDKSTPVEIGANGEAIFDRAKARLHAIRMDPGTYINDPKQKDEYVEWGETFDLDSCKGDISELLVVNVEVRGLYTQMVPSSASHADFWKRYFFKLYLLEQDEERKANLMKRAESNPNQDLAWDEEDDWCDMAAPTSPLRENNTPGNKEIQRIRKVSENEKRQEDTKSAQINTSGETEKNQDIEQTHTTEISGQDINKTDEQNVSDYYKTVATDDVHTNDEVTPTIRIEQEPCVDDTQEETKGEDQTSCMEIDTKKDTTTPLTVDVDTPDNLDLDKTQDNKQSGESELKVKERGDLVVVGTDNITPSSDSSCNSNKESTSLDDDWEKDFDIEVTEEDMRMAEEVAKKLKDETGVDDEDDDWENWE